MKLPPTRLLTALLSALCALSACDRALEQPRVDVQVVSPSATNSLPMQGTRVYVPVTFHAEAGPVSTSACLSMDEVPPGAEFGGVGPSFEALVRALKAKDKAAYEALVAADQLGPDAPCRDQAEPFFSQFEAVSSSRIHRVFAFDDLVVVHSSLRRAERDILYPFLFARTQQDKLSFLPCRPKTPGYALVADWLTSAHPGHPDAPRCAADSVELATHRIALGPESTRTAPLQLWLRGAPLDTQDSVKPVVDKVSAAFTAIQHALDAKDPRELAAHMTAQGGKRTSEWWVGASLAERDRFAATVLGQKPFFVFDASPLVVAYTRGTQKIQVMYFVVDASGQLVWANSAHVTELDKVFKRGALFAAADLPSPFSTLRTR